MIRQVDSVALGVIASKVTQTYAASAAWADRAPRPIIESVLHVDRAGSDGEPRLRVVRLRHRSSSTPLQFALVAT
jgi:hypothetical protein